MSEPLEISTEILGTKEVSKNNLQPCCANCNTALAGNYCYACGQTAHVHRSLGHLLEELLHGILHFDSKAWRTLPALTLQPGKLTRDYIHGKRAYYVSPLFLFLFLNLAMFVSLSYLGSNLGPDTSYKALLQAGMMNDLTNTQAELEALTAKQQTLPTNDPGLTAIATRIEQLKLRQAGVQKSLTASRTENDAQAAHQTPEAAQPDTPDQFVWLERNIHHALQNPDLVMYKMKGTASKFAIILIPISLPFMWLLFIRRKDVVVFDHCIFALYSLSFICLLIMLVAGFARLGWSSWAWLLILTIPPLHMFAQLRGAYQLTISAALWRTLALLLVASFALFTYFVVITWLSL